MSLNANKRSIKLVVIGDGMIGKTCLLMTYMQGEFPKGIYVPTIFEESKVDISIDNETCELYLYDTAGQEGLYNIRQLAYPGSDIFLICFALNNKDSFENIPKWVDEVQKHCPGIPYILVGTKADLRKSAIVECITREDAEKMAKKIKSKAYSECSSLENSGVTDIINSAIQCTINVKKQPTTVTPAAEGKGCCLLL